MKTKLLLVPIIILSLITPSFAHGAEEDPVLRERFNRLKEQAHELHLLVLEKKGIPRLEKAVPREAEIGEAAIIRGVGFSRAVDIYFDNFLAVSNVTPTDNTLVAFKVPEKLSGPSMCSKTPAGTVCALAKMLKQVEFETYDVRVKTSKGFSNIVKLKVVEEKN